MSGRRECHGDHQWRGGGICSCGARLRCYCGQFVTEDGLEEHFAVCSLTRGVERLRRWVNFEKTGNFQSQFSRDEGAELLSHIDNLAAAEMTTRYPDALGASPMSESVGALAAQEGNGDDDRT